MVVDYVKPQYNIVEHIMSNGKKRYEVHVTNYNTENCLVTASGTRRKLMGGNAFMYLKHQVEDIIKLHDRLTFQSWLRDVSQIGTKSVLQPNTRRMSL